MTQATASLPAQDLQAAHQLLARPFTPAAVEFMVIQAKEGKAKIATYLSRTSIEDRLDLVVGSDHWEAVPIPHAECVECRLTLFQTTKASLGQGADPRTQEANGFKRAARSFGVGRYLYTREPVKRTTGDGDLQVKLFGKTAWIPPRLVEELRREYEAYLAEAVIPVFGAPLDDLTPRPAGDAPDGTGSAIDRQPAAAEVPSNGRRNGGGRPQAVQTNGNGGPPADPSVRDRLHRAIEAGGFSRDAISNISELLYGERIVDRLASAQMTDLIDVVEVAKEGDFTDETFGGLASRGLEQADLGEARQEFVAYVFRRANRQAAQK
jgi:hypothetical protein